MAYIIDERPETMYAGLSDETKALLRKREIAEHGRVVSEWLMTEEDKRKKKRKKKLKRFRREQKKRRE